MDRMRTVIVTVGLVAFVAFGMSGTASAAIDKCQKAISKESGKLEAKMVKALSKCADSYQKAAVKGDPVSSITGKCNDALGKTFDIGNPSSSIAKAKAKLAGLIPGKKCTNADLGELGHLGENIFGDQWQKLVLVAAWKTAYENALMSNTELINMMQGMLAASGCPLCSLVSGAPCYISTCILAPGSGGPVRIGTAGGPVTLATTILQGGTPTAGCYVPSILGTGEYGLVSGAGSKGILPVVGLLPGVNVCVTSFRSEGYINCGAGLPRVDTDICVDHIVDDLGGGAFADDCVTGAATEICQPRVPDTVHTLGPGQVNGGACLNITTTSPGASGDAFFLATSRIQVVTDAERGADLQPCTADDTPATITAAASIPSTTGTATARVIDPGANDGWPDATAGPFTGVPFDCAKLFGGTTSPGKTVNAAAALHGLPGFDTAFGSSFICQ